MAKVTGVKNRRAAAIQQDEVLSSVKGLSLDSVSKSITDTQVEVQKVLADLSAKVMERLQQLEQIQEAIALKQEELNTLHQIEGKAGQLDELDEQITKQRRAWDEEQAEKKRTFAEMQSERNKVWKREEEEYQYKLAQEHRKLEDSFQALMEKQQRANADKQEQLDKNWGERETELKKRETELVELRTFKEQAPDMVKKEVNAQVAVATNSVKKEYETKMVLAAKDAETEKRLSEQTIKSLHDTITKQQAQLEEMKAQREQALKAVQEISGKALESASGRATTDALQRILERDQQGGKATK
jgi:colicin import membrane protein